MTSKLDAIKGVGPKTRRALLEAFGSVEGIRQATDDALVAAGARRDQLAALRAALGN
jgi:excinuclease ABC subunit C